MKKIITISALSAGLLLSNAVFAEESVYFLLDTSASNPYMVDERLQRQVSKNIKDKILSLKERDRIQATTFGEFATSQAKLQAKIERDRFTGEVNKRDVLRMIRKYLIKIREESQNSTNILATLYEIGRNANPEYINVIYLISDMLEDGEYEVPAEDIIPKDHLVNINKVIVIGIGTNAQDVGKYQKLIQEWETRFTKYGVKEVIFSRYGDDLPDVKS